MAPNRSSGFSARARAARERASVFRVGAITLVVAAIAVYFGFAKHIPFTHGFRVKAVFASANSIRKNSPVRIAGVNVGKVKGVSRQPGTDAAVVSMELNDSALPIHRDATLKIRPRIFLEGNFFVDLSPGTPSSPTVHENETLSIAQTAEPVQFDQILTSLQAPTRTSLQQVLISYGQALTYQPTPADDATQDRSVHGVTAAQALNRSYRSAGPAFRDTSVVNNAFLGTSPHDLSGLIAGLARVTRALDSRETQLQGFVTNFNTTMAALADQSANLRTTIRLLAPTLRHANAAFDDLNRAFPPTRAFAREILPGVRETPATIAASFPWIAETRGLLGPNELQGVARTLHPSIADLSRVIDASVQLLPQIDLTAKCATGVVLPTGNVKINDGFLSTNVENYKEFWYALTGLSGEGQNFDGNGMYVRFQPGGGNQTVSTGTVFGQPGSNLLASAVAPPLGTRPAYPGHRPPYKPAVPCYTQRIPDLNAAATGPAATTRVRVVRGGEGGRP
jgi:ABC-type transporter Mla subunit MlaD